MGIEVHFCERCEAGFKVDARGCAESDASGAGGEPEKPAPCPACGDTDTLRVYEVDTSRACPPKSGC